MKSNIYNIHYFLTILGIVLLNTVSARSEYTKTYTKTFSLAPDGKVNLENMHGQVNVKTWNKGEVYIKVLITVEASSASKAEDNFDRIDIKFTNDARYVSAKTSIDSKRSTWWFMQSWWDDDDVKIDYEVSMPASAKLELSHKYGNADLGTFSGDAYITHKYGDLTLQDVAGKLELDLAYGNAVVAKANHADITIAYYKFRMNEANIVTLNSKYSQIFIENANQINALSAYDGYHLGVIGTMTSEGKYDNIEIEKIDVLNVDAKYTKINLDFLLKRLVANMTYGGLEIDRLANEFEEINITSRYAGLEIDTDDVLNYKIDVQGRYTGVDLPADMNTSRDQRENNNITVVGQRGSGNAGGIIRVRAEYGGLKLR